MQQVKTIPILVPNYVYERRWGDARFDEGDQVQLSDLMGGKTIQLSFVVGRSKILLGRGLPNATNRFTILDFEADTTLRTISHDVRQQLLQRAANRDNMQERAETLNTSNLRVTGLQLFAANTLSISRRHALLEKDGHSITITDLHSTNGTYLNGARLNPTQRRVIRNNDKLQLGDLRLWVRFCREVC
jgi:hypothetical protein